MRYWIYWNDLVQGPFEVDELRTLRAFTADLSVCEEDRQDWTPAAAISELLPYFQPMVSAYAAPSPAPPPPPPPSQPPMLSPLQGEFFSESSKQQSLFDLNGSKHFMFRPAQDEVGSPPEITLTPFTSPFRFFSTNLAPWDLPEISVPRPIPLQPLPRPIIEPDVPSEAELGVLEPEDTIVLEPSALPPPVIQAPPKVEVVPPPPLPPPAIENIPLPPPRPKEKPIKVTPAPRPLPVSRSIPMPDYVPSRRRVEEEPEISETTRLWPWIVGVCLFVAGSISVVYLRSTHPTRLAPKINDTAPVAAPQTVSSELGVLPADREVPSSALKSGTRNPEPGTPAIAPVVTPPQAHPSTWQTLPSNGSQSARAITPAAVMVDPQGQVWITDPVNHQVQAAQISEVTGALQAASWDVKGQAGSAPGQFHAPIGMAVDAQGHVWVADKGNNRIQMYDPATAKWTALGESGSAAGQFNAPAGVAVDPQGRVWVADKANHRIQSYDPATQQWTSIGQSGSALGQFNYPAGIAVDAQGVVWIADQGNHRVQAYNPSTAEWKSYGQKGKSLGSFKSPTAVAVDPHGRIWITEQGNDRVQVYNPRTERWVSIGKQGRKTAEFNLPAGVAFDPQGRVWIADRGNHRLQVARVLTAVPLAAGKHVKQKVPIIVQAPTPAAPSAPVASAPAISPLSPALQAAAPPLEKPAVVPDKVPANNSPGMSEMSPAASTSAGDKWRGHEQDAIDAVLKQKIYDGKRTVGENAVMMLENMHEKELLHAGETGERLYLPDKISWSALHEEGPRYRVYLNFLAWQANGERVLARSDQFAVEMERKSVTSLDDATRHDFYDIAVMLVHKPDPKAADIQSVLDGVDAVNRHKLRAVIMKADKQKDEQKKIQAALQASQDKLERQVVYFRTKYAEKTLQNIAKAFDFTALMKGR